MLGYFEKTITRRYTWGICKFNHGIQTYIATKFKMNYNQGACWNIWSNLFWKKWCATQDYVEIMKFNTKIVWTIKYKNTIGRKKDIQETCRCINFESFRLLSNCLNIKS